MSTVDTGSRYGLVYLVYNTIGNLLTQDGQVRCFENAAPTWPTPACSCSSAACPPRPPDRGDSTLRPSAWQPDA